MNSVTSRDETFLCSPQGKHIVDLLSSKSQSSEECITEMMVNGVSQQVIEGLIDRLNPSLAPFIEQSNQSVIQLQSQFLENEFLHFDANVIMKDLDNEYLNVEDLPNINSNAIVISGVGTGKSMAAAKKAIEISTNGRSVLILCPRVKQCKQYYERLITLGSQSVYRWYEHHKECGQGIIIGTYDAAIKIFRRFNKLDISSVEINNKYYHNIQHCIVDEFHALTDDEGFRSFQNETLCTALNMMSINNISIHFYSATPRKKAIELLQKEGLGLSTIHMFKMKKQLPQVVCYPTSCVDSSLLLCCNESKERLIIHYNNKRDIKALATSFNLKGKKTVVLDADSMRIRKIDDLSKYDIIFTTSVIDTGFSIDDGIPTKVIVVAPKDDIQTIIQKCARVRFNVTEYVVLISNINYKPLDFQSWGWKSQQIIFNDSHKVPKGFVPGSLSQRKKTTLWVEGNDEINLSTKLLYEINANQYMRESFNKTLGPVYGFEFGSPRYDHSQLNKVELDGYVQLIDSCYKTINSYPEYKSLSESEKTAVIVSGLTKLSGVDLDVDHPISAFSKHLHSKYNTDIISDFMNLIGWNTGDIANIDHDALISWCDYFIRLCMIPEYLLEAIDEYVPKSIPEVIKMSKQERISLLFKITNKLVFLQIYSNWENITKGYFNRPNHISPEAYTVAGAAVQFKFYCDERLQKDKDFVIKSSEVKEWFDKFFTFGNISGGQRIGCYYANVDGKRKGILFTIFTQMIRTFCSKERRRIVTYNVTQYLMKRLSIVLGKIRNIKQKILNYIDRLPWHFKNIFSVEKIDMLFIHCTPSIEVIRKDVKFIYS